GLGHGRVRPMLATSVASLAVMPASLCGMGLRAVTSSFVVAQWNELASNHLLRLHVSGGSRVSSASGVLERNTSPFPPLTSPG
ncbi:MAG TPA: hypothetical protein VIV60_04545, partial [Polyangiaceae bacterium]